MRTVCHSCIHLHCLNTSGSRFPTVLYNKSTSVKDVCTMGASANLWQRHASLPALNYTCRAQQNPPTTYSPVIFTMRRRGNKSFKVRVILISKDTHTDLPTKKVPNVKLRPADKGAYAQPIVESCWAQDTQTGSDDTAGQDSCPRPLKGVSICATGVTDKVSRLGR